MKRAQSAIESPSATARLLRGQSAMEYLMTYGWAILVIIIVIAVLFYIGVLNPRNVTPTSCTFPPGISCTSYKLDTNNTLNIRIGQSVGHRINLTGINCTLNTTRPPGFFDNGTTILPTRPMNSGDSASMQTVCVGEDGQTLDDGNTGDTMRFRIWVHYSEVDPGAPIIDRVIVGDMAVRYE